MTIIENDQITTELAYQAKHTMEMMEQNKKLTNENVELKRKMELVVQIEKDLCKKNSFNQKTIKSLHAKIQGILFSFLFFPLFPLVPFAPLVPLSLFYV